MQKTLIGIGVLIVIAAVALFVLPNKSQAPITNQTATTTPKDHSDLIVVYSPKPDEVISSTTITITGKARGTWYFEGTFPIEIANFGGTTIAKGQAHALGNWTTEDFVPFTAFIKTSRHPSEPLGVTIYLFKDNPSGDPAKEMDLNFDVVLK